MHKRSLAVSQFLALCVVGVWLSSAGCQAVLDRTVNNGPVLPGGNSIQHYAGGGMLGEQWTRDGQCRVILDWLSKVKQEFPALRFDPRGMAVPMGYYVNLFRDSTFVPVFGMSYHQMPTSTSTHLWQRILHTDGCLGIGRFGKYHKDFQPYAGILQYAFQEGPLSGGEDLKKAVEKLNREEPEMAEAWRKLREESSSRDNYQELQGYAKPIPRNLRWERDRVMYESQPVGVMPVWADRRFNSLWPSETQAFHAALTDKLKAMAQTRGEATSAGNPQRSHSLRDEQTIASAESDVETTADPKEERVRHRREQLNSIYEESLKRSRENIVPNDKPYWTSASRDVVIKMSMEPWCIPDSRRNGRIEVHTTDSTLYKDENPRLQTIFAELSTRIRTECPGMKELVLHGFLEKDRVFYAWVALERGGQLESRMDVKQDQRDRAAAQEKAAACKSAPIRNPWGKAGPSQFDEPNPCQMLLAMNEVLSATHSRIAGPCSLLNYSGCAASARTDADAFQLQLTHFEKGTCDRHGDCTFSATFHCQNFRYCALSGIVSDLPLAGRAAFSRSPNGTWVATPPTLKRTTVLGSPGLPVEQLCPEVMEAIRCPPRSSY